MNDKCHPVGEYVRNQIYIKGKEEGKDIRIDY